MADKKIDLGVVKLEELQKVSDTKQLPEFYKGAPIVNYLLHGALVAEVTPYADPLTMLFTTEDQVDEEEPVVDEYVIELTPDKSIVEGLNETCKIQVKNDDELLEVIEDGAVYDRNISGYNITFTNDRFIDYFNEVEIDLDVFIEDYAEYLPEDADVYNATLAKKLVYAAAIINKLNTIIE